MKDILNKLLAKIGKEYRELTEVEKATYNEWQEVLSKDVKIEDVASFLERQVKQLSRELRQKVTEGKDRESLLITAKLDNFEQIILFIREPLEAKKRLEAGILENLK